MTNPAENSLQAAPLPRIRLIDTMRGLALIAMASYHFTWDLGFFGYIDPATATRGLFRIYARVIASSFLFLAGVSLVLAHTPEIRWQSFWKRFAIVAGSALAISLATLFAFPQEWIYFGILHNIALSSLVGLAFLRLPLPVAIMAPVVIVLAMIADASLWQGVLHWPAFDTRALSWLGFAQVPPRSNDYVPLFPWIAALLAGIAAARLALVRGWTRPLAMVQQSDTILGKAGRHSLLIYLLHQPVLLALLYVFSLVSPPPPPDLRAGYVGSCNASCLPETGDQLLCERFCGCTADRLISQNLMTPLQSGAINPQDEKIQMIAAECSVAEPLP